MGGKSVILADKDVIFTMELEGLMRSNGFGPLGIHSFTTEQQLVENYSTIQPDVLVLGDLESTEPTDSKLSAVPFLSELLDSWPNVLIIDVLNRNDLSIPSSTRKVVLEKPIQTDPFMSSIGDWFDELDKQSTESPSAIS